MRTAGIIRIIVGFVIAALLTAILVAVLAGDDILDRIAWDGGWIGRIADHDTYSSGGVNADEDETVVSDQASVSAGSVQKIVIDWVAGGVSLRVGSSSDIVFYETSYRDLTDRQMMRYSVSSGGVLHIRYCEDLDNILSWISTNQNMPSKELVMEVPQSLMDSLTEVQIDTVSAEADLVAVYGNKTEISTVSGKISCAALSADTIELSTTSGSVVCEDCSAEQITIDNVSGSIRADGAFDKIGVNTVSGSVRVGCTNVPDKITVDGVSGSITIALPENAEFTAKLDSVSGSISCEFPGTLGNDKVVVGDGDADYRFNTVSGSLRIEQN